MKYWINYGGEVQCKSEIKPAPLLFGEFDGITAVEWTEIPEQDFNELMRQLIEIEQETEESRKRRSVPTFAELRQNQQKGGE